MKSGDFFLTPENIFSLPGLETYVSSDADAMLIGQNATQRIFRITDKQKSGILKWGNPDQIKKEAAGLRILSRHGLTVPQVLLTGRKYFLMEYIKSGNNTEKHWENAGRELAMLHSQTWPYFGYFYDNYIGALKQYNFPPGGMSPEKRGRRQKMSWPDFFAEYRVRIYLKMYWKNSPSEPSDKSFWDKFIEKIPSILPRNVHPSLIHGDLWGGNLLAGKNSPAFIDPAVNYADRYMDLAMTRLFGGFRMEFYSAYREMLPIEPHFEDILPVYQLYYILVHAVLFGSHYYADAKEIARKFIDRD